MPRIVNEADYALRRNGILDAAQRLAFTRGYERMTIQDMLDDLHISKGAFYHYFDSKGAVLEALVERLVEKELLPLLIPIVDDPRLTALKKLNQFFSTTGSWKITRKTFMLDLLRIWLADENAIVRQKLLAISTQRVTPLLTRIIHQGIQEGALATSYPDQAGEIVFFLLQNLGDTLGVMLLAYDPQNDNQKQLEVLVAAYTDALERVLGAPKNSIVIIDGSTMEEWFKSAFEHERIFAEQRSRESGVAEESQLGFGAAAVQFPA